jgi:cytochrome oxidase Cu insertion factor (SCO1/SenC/PrrC family)
MKKNILIAILFLAAASGWGFFAYYYPKYSSKTYFGNAYQVHAPGFSLTDHDGNPITLDDLQDKIVLMAWGYTNCPDVCPTTLAKLSKVMERLGGDADDVRVLFVTVDPAEIDKAASDYNVTIVKHEEVYGRSETDTWDRYLMTHTNTVHLINRDGNLVLSYPHYKLDVEGITSDIHKLLQ